VVWRRRSVSRRRSASTRRSPLRHSSGPGASSTARRSPGSAHCSRRRCARS